MFSSNTSRIEANVRALSELGSDRADSALLKNYTGWGGLRQALYTPTIYHQIKKLLSEEEIVSLKRTIKTGYYTPPSIVNFIYKNLDKLQCRPTKILEPSGGHGIFIDLMPIAMRQSSSITVVEPDAVNCRFLKKLCPDVRVFPQGFELFNEGGFDLIIGNPPFGQIEVLDKKHPGLSQYSIHHYFIAKSMRLLKPNGMLAMVVSRYFLDNKFKHVRHIIAKEGGSLVAAFRLPDDMFAGAKVTVDIVFLQKKVGGRGWLGVQKISSRERFAYLNNYFFLHRKHVFGRLKFIDVYGRTEITCKRNRPK